MFANKGLLMCIFASLSVCLSGLLAGDTVIIGYLFFAWARASKRYNVIWNNAIREEDSNSNAVCLSFS